VAVRSCAYVGGRKASCGVAIQVKEAGDCVEVRGRALACPGEMDGKASCGAQSLSCRHRVRVDGHAAPSGSGGTLVCERNRTFFL